MATYNARGLIEKAYQMALVRLAVGIAERFTLMPGRISQIAAAMYLSPEFVKIADLTARGMVMRVSRADALTWRQAARMHQNSRRVYSALRNELQGPYAGFLQSQIARNAALIRTLPQDIAADVAKYISDETAAGIRMSSISESLIAKIPNLSVNRARTLARTETNKTHTAVIQARADNLNLPWYVWHSMHSGTTRESHRIMDGVLCRWSDPPCPEALAGESRTYGNYNAGEIFNCRCWPEPVINLDSISWPHKVHYGGKIVTMTKNQFKAIAA